MATTIQWVIAAWGLHGGKIYETSRFIRNPGLRHKVWGWRDLRETVRVNHVDSPHSFANNPDSRNETAASEQHQSGIEASPVYTVANKPQVFPWPTR